MLLMLILITALSGYISMDSLYRSLIVSGPSLPIVGVHGFISSSERHISEISSQGEQIIRDVAINFQQIYWGASLSTVLLFVASSIVVFHPFMSRLKTQLLPLTYRLSWGFFKLYSISFILELPFLLLLLMASNINCLIIYYNYIGCFDYSRLLILSQLMVEISVAVSIYSIYFIVNRIDVALMVNLLYVYVFFQYFEPGILAIGLSILYCVTNIVVTLIAVSRRWLVL